MFIDSDWMLNRDIDRWERERSNEEWAEDQEIQRQTEDKIDEQLEERIKKYANDNY